MKLEFKDQRNGETDIQHQIKLGWKNKRDPNQLFGNSVTKFLLELSRKICRKTLPGTSIVFNDRIHYSISVKCKFCICFLRSNLRHERHFTLAMGCWAMLQPSRFAYLLFLLCYYTDTLVEKLGSGWKNIRSCFNGEIGAWSHGLVS